MNKLRIHSVPSTGTHFLSELLKAHGFDNEFWHFKDVDPLMPGQVFAPIRRPEDVYVTWYGRHHGDSFNWLLSWQAFNQAFEHNPQLFILPVDTDDRDIYLHWLSAILHTELATDWTPVNCSQRVQVDVPDLSDVYALPVVRKFYG